MSAVEFATLKQEDGKVRLHIFSAKEVDDLLAKADIAALAASAD